MCTTCVSKCCICCCFYSLLSAGVYFSLIFHTMSRLFSLNRRIYSEMATTTNNNKKQSNRICFYLHPMESRSVINIVLDLGPLYLQWFAAFELYSDLFINWTVCNCWCIWHMWRCETALHEYTCTSPKYRPKRKI